MRERDKASAASGLSLVMENLSLLIEEPLARSELFAQSIGGSARAFALCSNIDPAAGPAQPRLILTLHSRLSLLSLSLADSQSVKLASARESIARAHGSIIDLPLSQQRKRRRSTMTVYSNVPESVSQSVTQGRCCLFHNVCLHGFLLINYSLKV